MNKEQSEIMALIQLKQDILEVNKGDKKHGI